MNSNPPAFKLSCNAPTIAISKERVVKSSSFQSQVPVSIFWHPTCSMHVIPGHPEQPRRVDSILQLLRQEISSLEFRDAPLIAKEHILLFHSPIHLQKMEKCFEKAESCKDKECIALH